MWVFLNDRFVPRGEAVVSAFDHGFLYGDGVYETLRAYGGRVFMLAPHLARLYRSGDSIGLQMPMAEQDWPPLLQEALARNGLSGNSRDAFIRITVSRGEGEIGLDPGLCPKPTVLIIVKPLTPYPPHLFEEGVRLTIASVRRNLAAALPPRIKSLSFLNNILAKQEATKAGAFDAVMLNADGALAECTVCNLFFVRKGRLCTPSLDCGILDGITRDVVLTLAREDRIPVQEGRYSSEVLMQAEECFLTNTSMEVMPVSEVDGTKIGAALPGPLTRRLRELFRQSLPRFLS